MSLIDRFYEAAVIPEMWTAACDALAEEVDAYDAAIFTIDTVGTYRVVSSAQSRDLIEAFTHSALRFENIRPARALERAPFTFAREIDVMSMEEFENDVILKEILHPAGVHWDAGCIFQEPSGHMIMIDLHRKIGTDHFSDADLLHLNAMKPDFARAIYLASQLAFSEARTVADTLSLVNLPAAVIGFGERVMAVNAQMEALAPRIRTGAGDTLHLDSSATRKLLSDALQAFQPGRQPAVQSIPMSPLDGAPPLILHVLPIRRAARDIFSRCLAIVIVTVVGAVGPPEARVLAGLFDLTPMEAKVARGLASGETADTLARMMGISIETVRSHIKRIMGKTGTRRQAELVRLLLGLSSPALATTR